MSPINKLAVIALGCVIAAIICQVSAVPLAQNNQNSDPEPLSFADSGFFFLSGNECGPQEELATGMLPSCEPTCRNPRPICAKIFVTQSDYVPCFCKKPLVRNEQTKQCVPVSECPPNFTTPPMRQV